MNTGLFVISGDGPKPRDCNEFATAGKRHGAFRRSNISRRRVSVRHQRRWVYLDSRSLFSGGRLGMKRDMVLIRKILIAIEDRPPGSDSTGPVVMPEGDPVAVGEHVHLLVEGGFVEAINVTAQQDPHPQYLVERLTWEGHDFLCAIRHDTAWAKISAELTKHGGSLPFEIVKAIGIAALRLALKLP
jgi:hypothetical protein